MDIKLFIDNEEKTFTVPFVKARMFRKALELNKKFDLDNLTVDSLDALVDYVVELYNNQFSQDQFYDGIAAKSLTSTLVNCLHQVTGVAKSDNPNV